METFLHCLETNKEVVVPLYTQMFPQRNHCNLKRTYIPRSATKTNDSITLKNRFGLCEDNNNDYLFCKSPAKATEREKHQTIHEVENEVQAIQYSVKMNIFQLPKVAIRSSKLVNYCI